MQTNFTQLLIDQHQAIAALEAAMEKLFATEKTLIQENPKLPKTTRVLGRDAALELVQLVVDQKLKDLAVEPVAESPANPDQLAETAPITEPPATTTPADQSVELMQAEEPA